MEKDKGQRQATGSFWALRLGATTLRMKSVPPEVDTLPPVGLAQSRRDYVRLWYMQQARATMPVRPLLYALPVGLPGVSLRGRVLLLQRLP